MTTQLKIVLLTVGSILAFAISFGSCTVSVSNRETRLRNSITAKQVDNTSEFDNMWKKIQQVAQVTDAQKQALLEIFTGYADRRSPDKQGGALANWVAEAVPNVDTSTFNQLMNTISGSRDSWTMRQKELIDLKREHDNLRTVFPSNMVCAMLGRSEITIKVITSDRTEEVFKTSKDNDTQVFPKR